MPTESLGKTLHLHLRLFLAQRHSTTIKQRHKQKQNPKENPREKGESDLQAYCIIRFKHPSFQEKKITSHLRKQESMTQSKKKTTENVQ